MSYLLELNELAVSSQGFEKVAPLSFALNAGESVTILGETGSGKSLFAKAIFGDLPSGFNSHGEVLLNNKRVDQLPSIEREALWGRDIAILPQEPRLALSPLMRIGEQISEVYRWVNNLSRHDTQSAMQSDLDSVGLQEAQNQFPVEISGGMAQRAAFLCARAAGGKVLIADEPTKGLDDASKAKVISALKMHKQTGCLVTITHDLDVAKALGGRIYVLYKGQWQSRDLSFEQWLNNTQDHYSQSLISAASHVAHPSKRQGKQQEPLIEVEDLSAGFDTKQLFTALSFNVARGEVVGFSGPSGCGKSTLGDILLGLKQGLTGKVVECRALPIGRKVKLYQDPPQAFSSTLTLRQQVNDLCRLHDIDNALVLKFAEQLQLSEDVLDRYANQVSGGELQRVAILRILLLQPELIIADEPTTRLDPQIARSTLDLLVESAKRINCALVLITHSQHEVDRYCDKVLTFAPNRPVEIK